MNWADDPSQVDSMTLLKNVESFLEKFHAPTFSGKDRLETNLIAIKELIRREKAK